ncbi:hypothetical protein BZG36_04098 [Bifiguratus adelaidae]|uniref:AB hydrolase-1 domain-containing protein n=1 Tax=Bifiguratus adelaidae TaxID=1938954 RepID=A0A261XVR8_9FUNG|nr:hypothetical protein BZG36_04098 [Bifiguratus adelaidae]
MEKAELELGRSATSAKIFSNRTTVGIFLASLVLYGLYILQSLKQGATSPKAALHSYQQGNFTWTTCHGNFSCSTLEVPVDYHSENSATFNISLIRLKATKEPYKGPLFINPGGPGGSGVSFVLRVGDVLSRWVQGHYDIIGFDPRGIGESKTIRCFNDGIENKFFMANRPPYVGEGENPANFAIVREALVNQCFKKSGDFLPFVSTAMVARDLDALREAFGQEYTNYLGLSYSTFLGATYMNMFPDKVGKVVLDGVLDPRAFSGEIFGPLDSTFRHTDDVVDAFGAACEVAGPGKCALAHPDKALAINGKHYVAPTIRKFLKELALRPILANSTGKPFITEADATQVLFTTTYKVVMWPDTAKAFADAIFHGDGTALANLLSSAESERCPLTEAYSLGTAPVLCIDGHHDDHNNLTAWEDGIRKAGSSSPLFAPLMGWEFLSCLYWPVKAAERYAGPWNKKTSNKVLIVGATGDPVTPVENAKFLEELMGGSGVFFQHEGWGHCSLGQPSKCTLRTIRDYFVHGLVPKKGSGCSMETEPFEEIVETAMDDVSFSDLHRMADAIPFFK